jgi:hypothetical protein
MSDEITVLSGNNNSVTANWRQSTDVAHVCREIVNQTAKNIGGRRYVQVEGWQSIATAYGCVASSRDVERIEGGYRAIGEVKRMDNGQVISQAEGFVGDDEATWGKRPVYARRAMAQTRGISRACRSAFAHVVVLIDKSLSTTPAEEVPEGGFEPTPKTFTVREVSATEVTQAPRRDEVIVRKPTKIHSAEVTIERMEQPEEKKSAKSGGWRDVAMRFGSKKGNTLGDIEAADQRYLKWLSSSFEPGLKKDGTPWPEDVKLRNALDEFKLECESPAPSKNHGSDEDVPF